MASIVRHHKPERYMTADICWRHVYMNYSMPRLSIHEFLSKDSKGVSMVYAMNSFEKLYAEEAVEFGPLQSVRTPR